MSAHVEAFLEENSDLTVDTITASHLWPLLQKLEEESGAASTSGLGRRANILCGSLRQNYSSSMGLAERLRHLCMALYEPSKRGANNNNELLIKATVGKGKFSTRDLPDLAHVYGRKNVKDAENAGQVALNWTAGAASEEETAGLDIIKMNKDAIRAGNVSAKAINAFKKKNGASTKYVKTISGSKSRKKLKEQAKAKAVVFGVIKKQQHDIKKIVQQNYADFSAEEAHYKDLSGKKIKGKLPKPLPTRSSTMAREWNTRKPANKAPFKMKRFAKVKGTGVFGRSLAAEEKEELAEEKMAAEDC